MRRLKQILALAILLVPLSCCVVACGGDDDDDVKAGSGTASTTAGVLDQKSGLRIKSLGDFRVYYADNGRIDYITEGSVGRYDFAYNPNTITYVEDWIYEKEGAAVSVGYNASGYLASTSYSEKDTDGDDPWEESSQSSLSYDGSGHLTKISVSGTESGYEKGERFTENWTSTITLTWRNNRLMQVVWTERYVEDGDEEYETETFTYEYDNEDYVNAYCQWAPSIAQWLDDIEEVLAYVGLLGVGPAELPSSGEKYEEETYDGKTHTNERSYTFRYGFNADGSVSYTTVDGTRYSFSYDYTDADSRTTRAAWNQPQADSRQLARQMGRLFHHSHRSRVAR